MLQDSALRQSEDGAWCVEFFAGPDSWTVEDSLAAYDRGLANVAEASQRGATDPICPGSPGPDGTPAATVTPSAEVAVWNLWERHVDLPAPSLAARPDYAVTGIPVFLEITGPPTRHHAFGPGEALGYTITIDVASHYDIDWGDGTITTGVTSQGGPWPHGDVHHTYRHATKDTTITVTQRWTATWTATGWGTDTTGTINGLYTTATLPMPIWQIQAVIDY